MLLPLCFFLLFLFWLSLYQNTKKIFDFFDVYLQISSIKNEYKQSAPLPTPRYISACHLFVRNKAYRNELKKTPNDHKWNYYRRETTFLYKQFKFLFLFYFIKIFLKRKNYKRFQSLHLSFCPKSFAYIQLNKIVFK